MRAHTEENPEHKRHAHLRVETKHGIFAKQFAPQRPTRTLLRPFIAERLAKNARGVRGRGGCAVGGGGGGGGDCGVCRGLHFDGGAARREA